MKYNRYRCSFMSAMATAVYITLVAFIMNYAERIFGTTKNMVAPVAFLLLFVTSAAITGGLVLGRPVLMYLDGEKKEAVNLFIFTVVWLFIFTALALILNILL